MSTSREEQLDALAVQLREAAYFCTKLEDLEIHCEKVAAELARLAATPKAGVDREVIAREICLSYGRDPDEPTSPLEMCTADNQPVPTWEVYNEQAEWLLERYTILALPSVLGGVDQESIATKPTTDPTVASGTEISGWKLVPVRATRAMTLAACDVLPSCEHVFGWAGKLSANVYERMLEAAPSHEGGGDA